VAAAEGAEGHRAAGQVPGGVDDGGELLDRGDRALGVGDQGACRVGEDQFAVGADEQVDSELLFESPDLLGQAGLAMKWTSAAAESEPCSTAARK
jgi:hypothetical protein